MCEHTKEPFSASNIDFQPTLTYVSASADLRQQRLTSFCTVCGVFFDYKRENTVVSSGVRGVTNMTNICSQLAECLYATFCNQMIVHHHEPKCAKKMEFCLQGQVTVWA